MSAAEERSHQRRPFGSNDKSLISKNINKISKTARES